MSKILDIARRTFDIEAESIKALGQNLGLDFETAVKEILASKGKLIVTGMGKSGIVGRKIAATMASTGTPSFFMHPGEAFHGDLGMVEADDIVLAISHSGETDEVLKLIPFFKDNGNKILGMTGNRNSTLALHSDCHLEILVKREACPLELAPTSSTTITMVMGDALAIALMELRDFRRENYARFHPGGSIGRRLLYRVENMMRVNDLPVIGPNTRMVDIISSITKGKLGLVVVSDNSRILGIITDGDMRRTFEKMEEKSFRLVASDIMTKNPKCVSRKLPLIEAQQIMIDCKITSLLVTIAGEPLHLQGVIQVYDIK
jgi:arabinose-5-phosphate isomerase